MPEIFPGTSTCSLSLYTILICVGPAQISPNMEKLSLRWLAKTITETERETEAI